MQADKLRTILGRTLAVDTEHVDATPDRSVERATRDPDANEAEDPSSEDGSRDSAISPSDS